MLYAIKERWNKTSYFISNFHVQYVKYTVYYLRTYYIHYHITIKKYELDVNICAMLLKNTNTVYELKI